LFIKRTKRTLRGKTYTNHLLVESVATERGPRHRVVCSLGSLAVPRHGFSWERGRFNGALFRGNWRVGYGVI
jgi:hypothetical protein